MSRIENYEECIAAMPREQQYSSCDELLFRVPALQKKIKKFIYRRHEEACANRNIANAFFA